MKRPQQQKNPKSATPDAPVEEINFYEAVYRVVRAVPRGRLMTYGQIAVILGHPRAARAVGYALKACRGKDVPWQRVINAQGQISARGEVERPMLQRALLEKEGVKFDRNETCDLKKHRWEPKDPDQFLFRPKMDFPL
jgi:methylated-DNA-protein-cysteine methyltransferase-like protein